MPSLFKPAAPASRPLASPRGRSVAALLILRPKDAPAERYVILTQQPRIGIRTGFELPTGIIDTESGNITGSAMQEIREETGLILHGNDLIDMTALARDQARTQQNLDAEIYPRPVNLQECIPILLWEKSLDRKQIESLKGRLAGARVHGDGSVILRFGDYSVLYRDSAWDARMLAAWSLYEGLSRLGRIEEALKDIRVGKLRR